MTSEPAQTGRPDPAASPRPRDGQIWRGRKDPTRTVQVTAVLDTYAKPLDVRYKVLTPGVRPGRPGRHGACFLPQFLSRYEPATPTGGCAAGPEPDTLRT